MLSGLEDSWLRRQAARGRLDAGKVRGRWETTRAALDRYMLNRAPQGRDRDVYVPAKVGRLLEAMERDPLRSQVPGEARGAGPSADQSPSSGLTANSNPDRLQANFSA